MGLSAVIRPLCRRWHARDQCSGALWDITRRLCPSVQRSSSRPIILSRFGVPEAERSNDGRQRRAARCPIGSPPEDARSTWTPGRPVRRTLVAAYLLTLAALATVGWIDALHGGARESDPTRTLWVALLIATLVQVALLNKATHGQFTLRLHQLDEHQRAARDRGYRYGFRILASAVTALLAVALSLPVDRLLGATNRMAWSAVAIVVVYLMWMLPTMVVAWMEPDPPRRG